MTANGLTICLRRAGLRLRPSMNAQVTLRPLRERFARAFRWIQPAFLVPHRIPSSYQFYLPSKVAPNSKAKAVLHELSCAGIDETKIWTQKDDLESKAAKLIRRIPRIGSVLYRTLGHQSNFDVADRWTILGYSLYRDMLRRNPHITPVIISDVSPELNMLWAAAARENHRLIWWQDDYHHAHRLPYPVTDAAVLNEAGAAAVKQSAPFAKLAARPAAPCKPICLAPEKPRLGVAVNASFSASLSQLSVLAQLRDALDAASVCVRLHPNSALHNEISPKEWLSFAPQTESLAEFAARIDLAIAGNTATQLRLIAAGIPVAHVTGLDGNGFDLYGYVHSGLCFGARTFAGLSVAAVNEHYTSPECAKVLSSMLGLGEHTCLPDLSALSR